MIFGKAIFCMAVGYGVDLHKIFAFIVEKQLCNLRLLSSKCSDCGFNLNLSDPCIGIPRDAFECSNLNDLDLPLESNQPHPPSIQQIVQQVRLRNLKSSKSA